MRTIRPKSTGGNRGGNRIKWASSRRQSSDRRGTGTGRGGTGEAGEKCQDYTAVAASLARTLQPPPLLPLQKQNQGSNIETIRAKFY